MVEKEYPKEYPTELQKFSVIQDMITRMSNRQHTTKLCCLLSLAVLNFLSGVSCFTSPVALIISLLMHLILIFPFGRMDFNFLRVERLYRDWHGFLKGKTFSWNDRPISGNFFPVVYEWPCCELDPREIERVLLKHIGKVKRKRKNWSLTMYYCLPVVVLLKHLIYFLG